MVYINIIGTMYSNSQLTSAHRFLSSLIFFTITITWSAFFSHIREYKGGGTNLVYVPVRGENFMSLALLGNYVPPPTHTHTHTHKNDMFLAAITGPNMFWNEIVVLTLK